MRWLMIGAAGWMASGAAAAQPAVGAREGGRHIERITMQDGSRAEPIARALETADLDRTELSMRGAFQIHDVPRQWEAVQIASRVARALGPGAQEGPEAAGAGELVVPPRSGITVPGWMQDKTRHAFLASYATPCGGAAYRVSGFLRPDAEARRARYHGTMAQIACEYGIPVGLFDAMIIQESGYQPNIFSPRNAFGLTQLMPGTAMALGVDRYRPEDNLRGGARYLRQQLDRFGYPHLALAAYNAGPGRVRDGLVPPITETRGYVANVLANWSRLAGASRHGATVTPTSGAPAPQGPPMGRHSSVVTFQETGQSGDF